MKSVPCRVRFLSMTGGDQKSGAFIRGYVGRGVVHLLGDSIGFVEQACGFFVVSHVGKNRSLQVKHLREITGSRTILASILNCFYDIGQTFFQSADMYQGAAIFQIDLGSEKWIVIPMCAEQDLFGSVDMLQTLHSPGCCTEKSSQT